MVWGIAAGFVLVVAAMHVVARHALVRFGTGSAPAPGSDRAAVIEVSRSLAQRDAFRAYRIIIDGTRAGELWPGGEVECPVVPGEHEVRVHIDWTGSRPVRVTCTPGGRVKLFVEPTPPGPAIADLFGSLTGSKPWLSLKQVPPDGTG